MSIAPDAMTWALRRLWRLWAVRHPSGPEHRSILVVDIAGFGRWHDPAQIEARHALTHAVRTGFRAAGVRWSDLAVQDRGDGMMVLVPAAVSKLDLLDTVIPRLVGTLRQHNHAVAPELRVRVRVGLHAGEVHRDPHGWVGTDLNTTCRLVDSAPVRERLVDHAVLVVSEVIHRGVVRHGYRRVDPASYSSVEVALKEVRERAWVTDRF